MDINCIVCTLVIKIPYQKLEASSSVCMLIENIFHKLHFVLQAIIDNKPCFNPYELSDDQLKQTLQERGKPTNGTREQMIKRIVEQDNRKILLL